MSLFLNYRAIGVTKEGDKITSVVVKHIESGKEQKFEAPLFSDCTGDGTIGYLAGADLNGSKLENYAKSIERSNQMLSLLNSAVEILRNKHKFGEQYYWILYYTYLSPQQLQNADEIIDKLRPHIANISYRTYYRKRPQAIEALSGILWGYTARNCLHIVNQFFPDN